MTRYTAAASHYAIFRCVCRSTITSVYIGRYILLIRFGSAAITIVNPSPFLDEAISVLFVLPFFDTQLFWTIVFLFPVTIRKRRRRRRENFRFETMPTLLVSEQ